MEIRGPWTLVGEKRTMMGEWGTTVEREVPGRTVMDNGVPGRMAMEKRGLRWRMGDHNGEKGGLQCRAVSQEGPRWR